MARLLGNEIILNDWPPLSGVPAPEYIPESWIGPHVGLRLVEGFRTLNLAHIYGFPSGCVSCWPRYQQEYSDLSKYADDEVWKAERKAEFWATVREVPSREQITKMEIVIAWPAHYLAAVPQLLRTVQACALVRSRHRSIMRAARRLGLPGRLLRRWNREGLDLIAAGLRRDAVRVF